jgi:hypothetical protein
MRLNRKLYNYYIQIKVTESSRNATCIFVIIPVLTCDVFVEIVCSDNGLASRSGYEI